MQTSNITPVYIHIDRDVVRCKDGEFAGTTPVRVLLADSHDLFRQGLSSLLARQSNIEVVGEAPDVIEAEEMVARLKPDIVLIELYMHGSNGLASVVAMIADHPDTTIAILTSSEDDNDMLAAIKLGVKGYIRKNSTLDELVNAVSALSQGEAYYSGSVLVKVLQEFTQLSGRRAPHKPRGIDELSDREKEVLNLVASGATNRDIATTLFITENTVKVHLRNIFGKLQLRNRQQAAAYAVQAGLGARMVPGNYAYSHYDMRA